MAAILLTLWLFVVDLFKSRSRLEAKNLFLRHQLNIALRRAPSRIRLSGGDRALLVCLADLVGWPGWFVGSARDDFAMASLLASKRFGAGNREIG